MLVKGLQYLQPRPARRPTRSRTSTRRKTGGFLDPLIGTVLLTVIGIADRAPARRRRPRCGSPSTAARPGWRARSSRASRSSPGTPEHRARDLRAARSSSSSSLGFLSFTAAGRRGLRPLVPDRRGDDVADRAAAGLRRHARGAAGDPRPRARGVLRARQDEGAPRSGASCCRRARPDIATGAALGMGRIAGDTAIVVILLGATLQLAAARAASRCSARCAAPAAR